ncbi:MAG: cbb3-type cytochrome oxidase assembly protein CcoS [Candidatus Eremiobacteraeota bacterium]|nr:cbb3-type cytochrome oxidase assembly protein CcoS [Candidatus Eremiobacteraeota bacterium]
MEILFILVPIALGFSTFALYSFFWAARNDQFDDLEGEAMRILLEKD